MVCRISLPIVLITVLFNFDLLSCEMISPDLLDVEPLEEYDLKERQSKALKLFKASLKEERVQQYQAIENIRKTMSFEKQYKLMSKVFPRIFHVIEDSKSVLEQSDYDPVLEFPTNQHILTALSQVLRSTAFYVEFQLKIPEITDQIMKKHNEWMILIKWAIKFSNSTSLYDYSTSRMVNLAAEDMNLIKRSPDFLNPYRMSDQVSKAGVPSKQKDTQKKKKFQKGPRMSRHTEL